MKCKKLLSALLGAVLCFSQMSVFSGFAQEDAVQNNMVDSGLNYTESVETINNPGAGYTSTLWYTCKPGDTPVKSPTGNLVLMFVDIGAFSSGANGTTDDAGNYTEGTDYDLDDAFFMGLRGTFENCRRNGCTIALRFRYDANGKTNPEPASFDQVLHHIQQIKENGLLEEYEDILMFVETGFVGAWGEQHSGKYTSLECKAQLVDAMLDCVPKSVPITVRTPNIFATWAGITIEEMADYVAAPGSDAARIGMYNDGYMGSDSDLGTYSNRAATTAWMNHQMLYTYYGGEFSGNLDWAKKYDTYLPENAVPEMYQTHLSYINSNIYQLYKEYTFGESYDVANVDNSAYYGQTVFQFIRDHLGYRFVVRKASHSAEVKQGETLDFHFSVENTGFANPIRPQNATLLLEKDGNYIQTNLELDPTTWRSCTTTDSEISVKLPGDMEAGNWRIFLRLSVGDSDLTNANQRTVRFANENVWNSSLGANYLGTVAVTKNEQTEVLTDHRFYQANAENAVISSGDLYTTNGVMILDGQPSGDTEWREENLLIADETNRMYVTNDSENLYVMAEIVQNVASPVYNIRIENADNGESYWLYYQPNGYVYFNHGAYDGCLCKHIDNYVEFQIPFGDVMGITPGTNLKSVRVFVQDMSISGWPSAGNLVSGAYTVTDTFQVYSAQRSILMKEQDDFLCNVETAVEHPDYQWLFNGEDIIGATEKTYCITDASSDSVGMYSVQVTAQSGTTRIIPICEVTDVVSTQEELLLGDCNLDGSVDLVDVVLLQKYLLGMEMLSEKAFHLSDMNQDAGVNGMDLVLLRAAILQTAE